MIELHVPRLAAFRPDVEPIQQKTVEPDAIGSNNHLRMAAGPPSGVTDTDLGRADAHIPERIGPFKIRGLLGKGGMGVVLDAVDPKGRSVALKLARPQGDADRTTLVVRRFLRECQILSQLDHPSIVKLVDAGDLDGLLYLAMERIEGVSLLAIRRKGPVDLDTIIAMGVQLADALAHMHEHGVIHRDIKPANILVDTSGKAVITDFGISSVEGAQGITRHGDLLGSPGFMPPEVTQGQPQTAAADQFALGRVLFELAARGAPPKLPLNAPLMAMLAASLKIEWNRFPPEEEWSGLKTVLRKMLADKPTDRYPTANEAKEALRALSLGDLADFDTISERVGKLELPPDHPWLEPSHEAAAPKVVAPKKSDITQDHDLLDLDRPAGERPELIDPSESEELQPTPSVAAEIRAARPGSSRGPGLAAESTDFDEKPTQGKPFAAPKFENPWEGKKKSVEDALPGDEEAETKRPALRLGGDRRGAPPTEGKPLNEIVANLEKATPDRPRTQTGGTGIVVPAPITHSEKVEVARLQTQLQQLKDQLVEARKQAIPQGIDTKRVGMMAGGALVLGLVIGFVIRPVNQAVPFVILTPSPAPGEAAFVFKGGERKQLTESQLKDAWTYLADAKSYLEKQDFPSAERYLKICIEDTDLPECHRVLAAIYSITGNPAARSHLLHYADVAPESEDAARIRESLK